jgi:hypothetical protein
MLEYTYKEGGWKGGFVLFRSWQLYVISPPIPSLHFSLLFIFIQRDDTILKSSFTNAQQERRDMEDVSWLEKFGTLYFFFLFLKFILFPV